MINLISRIATRIRVDRKRIKILQSVYVELKGEIETASKLLSEDPDELRLLRRLTTLSRHDKNPTKYINNLIYYLNLQPSDLIAWAELSEQYQNWVITTNLYIA